MGAFATESEHKTLTQTLFGKNLKSGTMWSVFILRLSLGFVFLWGGFEKMADKWGGLFWPGTPKTMATTGFLAHVSGPYATFFHSLAGNPTVEYLLVYGELAIGISLMFGLFTRVGGASGVTMSMLFYLSTLPVANNPFLNYYIIYALVFLAFIFMVPGRFLGLDGILQNVGFVERRPILKRIFTTLG